MQLEIDPLTFTQARNREGWPQWEATLQAEYQSLQKRGVFGPMVTNLSFKPIGHKLIFTPYAHGNIVRFKVRLVAQGYTQKRGIDFVQTCSQIMDSTSF